MHYLIFCIEHWHYVRRILISTIVSETYFKAESKKTTNYIIDSGAQMSLLMKVHPINESSNTSIVLFALQKCFIGGFQFEFQFFRGGNIIKCNNQSINAVFNCTVRHYPDSKPSPVICRN